LAYVVPVICAYLATFISTEIVLKIPVLCFLMGVKKGVLQVTENTIKEEKGVAKNKNKTAASAMPAAVLL